MAYIDINIDYICIYSKTRFFDCAITPLKTTIPFTCHSEHCEESRKVRFFNYAIASLKTTITRHSEHCEESQ